MDINGSTDPIANILDPNFNATRRVGKDYMWDGSSIGEYPFDILLHLQIQIVLIRLLDLANLSCLRGITPGGGSKYEIVPHDFELYRSGDYRCPHYLKNPPSSPYGNNEFSGELHAILVVSTLEAILHVSYLTHTYYQEVPYVTNMKYAMS